MKWFVKQLLVLLLILSVLCLAAVVFGRLDHTPSKLQALHFVCDREPCYRGIKVGTDRATVEKKFPDVAFNGSFVPIPSRLPALVSIAFDTFHDGKSVDGIGIERMGNESSLPFNVGE